MGKFKQLTLEERKAIIEMHKNGDSNRNIGKIFKKSHTAIGKIIQTFKQQSRVEPIKRTGRPRTTSKRFSERIKTISNANPLMSAPKIRAKLQSEGHEVPSTQTIRRRLHEAGKQGRVARKIPYVSKLNKKKRMLFYQNHALKSEEFWKRILWTDESMIRLKYSHGRVYVWRTKGDALSYKCTRPTFKGAEKGLMVWGCLSANGVGKIIMLEGKVNADIYLNVLKDVAIPEGNRLIGPEFVLQQDNAPIHTAKKVLKYLDDENIDVLKWPPQSPDLSPIENAWAILKLRISEQVPQNILELKKCIKETWEKITAEECKKLVLTMDSRLSKMSMRNGGHCGY